MSSEQYKNESDRWYRQGIADLEAARGSLQLKTYEWASFQAQQAGEKFLKAYWLYNGHDPWGHSLTKLIIDYPDTGTKHAIAALLDAAKYLDKMYIPTRYPNGLPDMIPAEVFTLEEASQAINQAQKMLDALKSSLGK
ncbi:MAG: HEPN domain-containing protein [Proteobacteria bacterium]|jgi:HEPN domain-containing protein|nr:HEPN domain-containing protein [Pseudomonadota bacterium]